MNYYAVLNISPDATAEEIRRAYREMARRYHPDAGEGSSADKFRELTEAYEILGDPARRRDYDIEFRRGAPIAVEFVPPGPAPGPVEFLSQVEFIPPVEPLRGYPFVRRRDPFEELFRVFFGW